MRYKKSNQRFNNLSYEDFKKLAARDDLSLNERIGFPNDYRDNFDEVIIQDIFSKIGVPASNDRILDIGCGCSSLTRKIIELCHSSSSDLVLNDSQEMLDALDDEKLGDLKKVVGQFPKECFDSLIGQSFSKIICYSVFHYVFPDEDILNFLDKAVDLLSDGGKLIVGDIPNLSMKNRFLSSQNGKAFHKAFMQSSKAPQIKPYSFNSSDIDDGLLFGILLRMRNKGLHAFLVPQNPSLPLSNRREDLLIYKP